jgi:hypothetical protein
MYFDNTRRACCCVPIPKMVTRNRRIHTFILLILCLVYKCHLIDRNQFRRSEGSLYFSQMCLDILTIWQFHELLKTNHYHKPSTPPQVNFSTFPLAFRMADLCTTGLWSRTLLKEVNSRRVKKLSICKNILWYALHLHIVFHIRIYVRYVRLWGHCSTSRKVAGSIPDGFIGIFHWHNVSGRNMVLRLTQPLTERSTRNISWG